MRYPATTSASSTTAPAKSSATSPSTQHATTNPPANAQADPKDPEKRTEPDPDAVPVCPRCLATSHSGAGGNRTPVHQPPSGPATTIPDAEPDAGSLAGQLILRSTSGLSRKSAVFLAVSGLSHRHPSLLLPGCDGLAPCGIAAHDDSLITWFESGGESELLIGNSFGCPV